MATETESAQHGFVDHKFPQVKQTVSKGALSITDSSSPFLASWHAPQSPSPVQTCSPASVAQVPSSPGAPCVFPVPSAALTSGSEHSCHCDTNYSNFKITNFS